MKILDSTKSPGAVLCLVFLSSCLTYKPYLDGNQASPETLWEKMVVGNKYEVILKTGQALQVKVDSLMEDRLTGRVTSSEKNFRQRGFIIQYSQIASVRNQKFNPALTIFAVGVPLTVVIVLFSTMEYGNIGWGN